MKKTIKHLEFKRALFFLLLTGFLSPALLCFSLGTGFGWTGNTNTFITDLDRFLRVIFGYYLVLGIGFIYLAFDYF